MSFRRENFHGGREYGSDSPGKGERRSEDRDGPIATWMKRQFSRLSPGSRKMGEGFSLLGTDERPSQARILDTDVFPMANRRRNAAEDLGQVRSCD